MAGDRERARTLATSIVSWAIGIAGVTLVVFAVFLVIRGGLPLVFLALLVGALGAGLAALGFFFQLVPIRIDELAEEKREYDRRVRAGETRPDEK